MDRYSQQVCRKNWAQGICLVLCIFLISLPIQAEESVPEVLVFVDVSGSMKQNDPNNIRAPALRLLAGLAPTTARVGIYTFGTSLTELVKPEMVDEVWRKQAEAMTHTIRSRDMYTNIEAALEHANRFWFDMDDDGTEKQHRMRNIILLTDGIVDIDQDTRVSEASRERILMHTLPDLIMHDAAIHTIALSDNADHELLQQLSLQSEGNYEKVYAAENLQKLFLKLFEQSAPQDTIPLDDNRFTVDASISEITLLLFSVEGKKTTLYSPDDVSYTKTEHPKYITWQKDIGFELITIKAPAPGEWLLDANLDPDNRAMIVTDLKLQADELPKHILQGESLDWTVWLEEEGELITRDDFLSLIDINVNFELQNGEQRQWKLPKADEHGLFKHQFSSEWPEGEFNIVLNIDGKTFQRQRRLTMISHQEPVKLEVIPLFKHEDESLQTMAEDETALPDAWQFSIKTYAELINLDSSVLNIIAISQTGKEKELTYEIMANEGGEDIGWQATLLAEEVGQYKVDIQFDGETYSGRSITIDLPTQELGKVVEITEPVKATLPTLKEILIPVGIGNILMLLVMVMVISIRRLQAAQVIYPEETL